MCVVCGCNDPSPAPRVSVPGLSAARTLRLEADVLGTNQRFADRNRAHFAAHGVTALNLLSGPGAGKTTLLCATIAALREHAPQRALAVIEGDQQTSLDAERIRAAGAPAVQVNTGQGCHLDAQMVEQAFAQLDLHAQAHAGSAVGAPLLFIENVGNLVCPALWDLGEAAKVVMLSVTEGEDKPLKYPDMFAAADLVLLTKCDLLPHLDFDAATCLAGLRRINPGVGLLQVSARTGAGMDAWIDWLQRPAVGRTHHRAPPRPAHAG